MQENYPTTGEINNIPARRVVDLAGFRELPEVEVHFVRPVNMQTFQNMEVLRTEDEAVHDDAVLGIVPYYSRAFAEVAHNYDDTMENFVTPYPLNFLSGKGLGVLTRGDVTYVNGYLQQVEVPQHPLHTEDVTVP